MKPLVLLAACLMLQGCYTEDTRYTTCSEVFENTYERGYRIEKKQSGSIYDWYRASHCIPCSQAKSPEARFVCFGSKE